LFFLDTPKNLNLRPPEMQADKLPDIPLERKWKLWYSARPTPEEIKVYGKYDAQEKIARDLHKDRPLSTIKEFYGNYLALPVPSSLPHFHKISLMVDGMHPSWTEPALVEADGGVIVLCFNPECADEVAEHIFMAEIAHLVMVPRDPAAADSKLCELVGCSLMRAKRWEAGSHKDWLECSIFHDCAAREKELLDALIGAIQPRVANFKMTHESKFHKLGH